jgi:hypothetical protein
MNVYRYFDKEVVAKEDMNIKDAKQFQNTFSDAPCGSDDVACWLEFFENVLTGGYIDTIQNINTTITNVTNSIDSNKVTLAKAGDTISRTGVMVIILLFILILIIFLVLIVIYIKSLYRLVES